VFKLAVIAGAVGAVVAVARKLMGGLGPEPGSADAPREWPSLVPDPVTGSNHAGDAPSPAEPPAPGGAAAAADPGAAPEPDPEPEPGTTD
jgi:hypothetical protein